MRFESFAMNACRLVRHRGGIRQLVACPMRVGVSRKRGCLPFRASVHMQRRLYLMRRLRRPVCRLFRGPVCRLFWGGAGAWGDRESLARERLDRLFMRKNTGKMRPLHTIAKPSPMVKKPPRSNSCKRTTTVRTI